jgi:hypothetical protein
MDTSSSSSSSSSAVCTEGDLVCLGRSDQSTPSLVYISWLPVGLSFNELLGIILLTYLFHLRIFAIRSLFFIIKLRNLLQFSLHKTLDPVAFIKLTSFNGT